MYNFFQSTRINQQFIFFEQIIDFRLVMKFLVYEEANTKTYVSC